MPTWAWHRPLIDIGRKGRDRNGRAYDMPIRRAYDGSPIQMVDASTTITGRMVGLGWDEAFTVAASLVGAADVPRGGTPRSFAADAAAVRNLAAPRRHGAREFPAAAREHR
ncbi:hypothetical protein [Aeromicrobium massiliense]|uniref:hypothetical protein n=1 Tax=Aeromicrobium massiliense TaxID=1464554 RepID=UPI0002F21E4E|nr:hypothetical protein [Aeromicrobium massiliense]